MIFHSKKRSIILGHWVNLWPKKINTSSTEVQGGGRRRPSMDKSVCLVSCPNTKLPSAPTPCLSAPNSYHTLYASQFSQLGTRAWVWREWMTEMWREDEEMVRRGSGDKKNEHVRSLISVPTSFGPFCARS